MMDVQKFLGGQSLLQIIYAHKDEFAKSLNKTQHWRTKIIDILCIMSIQKNDFCVLTTYKSPMRKTIQTALIFL